jgi:hypothetical protein
MHDDAPVTPCRLLSTYFTADLLFVIIQRVTASVCPAIPFAIGEQLVRIGQNFTGSSFANSGLLL